MEPLRGRAVIRRMRRVSGLLVGVERFWLTAHPTYKAAIVLSQLEVIQYW